jgi:hypothetical protein
LQVDIKNLIDDSHCDQTVRELRWPDRVACPSYQLKRIGNSNGLLAPPRRRRPPQPPPPAAHRAHGSSVPPSAPRLPRQSAPEPGGALRGVAWAGAGQAPQDGGGERAGMPWSTGRSGKPIASGIANAQKGVAPRRGAHGDYEPTRDAVGLGNPIARCLATTGRGNRRWDGGQLAMTQDARDDRLLGHGGNNAERAASAKGTGGQQQALAIARRQQAKSLELRAALLVLACLTIPSNYLDSDVTVATSCPTRASFPHECVWVAMTCSRRPQRARQATPR